MKSGARTRCTAPPSHATTAPPFEIRRPVVPPRRPRGQRRRHHGARRTASARHTVGLVWAGAERRRHAKDGRRLVKLSSYENCFRAPTVSPRIQGCAVDAHPARERVRCAPTWEQSWVTRTTRRMWTLASSTRLCRRDGDGSDVMSHRSALWSALVKPGVRYRLYL